MGSAAVCRAMLYFLTARTKGHADVTRPTSLRDAPRALACFATTDGTCRKGCTMTLRRLDFLLVMMMAAAAPALGQTGVPAGAPDLNGLWAHPALGFEPPVSGPGPVRNRSRLPSGA